MVGVLRSRGCVNCKRKKKGCDQQRPCANCKRLGLSCSYNSRPWKFVQEDGISPAFVRPKHEENATGELSLRMRAHVPAETPPPTLSISPRSLDRSAFESGVYATFWSLYLPDEDTTFSTTSHSPNITAAWMRTLPDVVMESEYTRLSLDACALTCIGRIRDSPELQHQGAKFYVRALRAVNHALQHPKTVHTDAVLSSCKLLAMYEMFRPYNKTAASVRGNDWQRHVAGTCKLILLRGPNMHIHQYGNELFQDVRMAAIVLSMVHQTVLGDRKIPNDFTGRHWRTVPWSNTKRSLHAYLLDLMAFVPEILNRFDDMMRSMGANPTALAEKAQDWLDDSLDLASRFRRWEQRAIASCSSTPDSNDTADATATLRSQCQRNGYGFYLTTSHYWATCTILYGYIYTLRLILLPSYELPSWLNAMGPLMNIVETCDFFFTPNAGLWGSQFCTYPIGVTIYFLFALGKSDGPEMESILTTLRSTPYGRLAGDFIASMAHTSSYQNPHEQNPGGKAFTEKWENIG